MGSILMLLHFGTRPTHKLSLITNYDMRTGWAKFELMVPWSSMRWVIVQETRVTLNGWHCFN